MSETFPGTEWDRANPDEVAMSADALETAGEWLRSRAAGKPFRVVVVRNGRMVAEWEHDVPTDRRRGIASATKSLFSCILAIAVEEGKVRSPDERVADYYPEMMEVPDGRGPKPGRFAKPEDRDITFRQLISNTSGYMKPGETPGSTFHYQTFGMNILSHAIAKTYGLYDSSDPERLPGIGRLIEEKIRDPIRGTWTHSRQNFKHPPEALTGIFGYFTAAEATARDMARMGLLWLRGGRWDGREVVPGAWLSEATRTAPDIRANCPPEQWCYGYGFWTNEHGLLWPDLPRDAFAASGAGRHHIFVCPTLDLVVAQSPGIYDDQKDEVNRELLGRIADACA